MGPGVGRFPRIPTRGDSDSRQGPTRDRVPRATIPTRDGGRTGPGIKNLVRARADKLNSVCQLLFGPQATLRDDGLQFAEQLC